MTPIGQHFLIHFIYSLLCLWNIECLGNSPWKRTAGPDLTFSHQTSLKLWWKWKRISLNLSLLNLKKRTCQISVLVSQHPSCAHPVPCVITLREWLSRCEGCGWNGIGRLQRVPVSLDNWCLLCFRGICAAPVDRAAPHLLQLSIFPLKPQASPAASPPGQPGSWERPC